VPCKLVQNVPDRYPLAGAAVRQRVRTGCQSYFHLFLQLARRAMEVPSKYLCSYSPPARTSFPQILGNKFLAHVGDVDLRCAESRALCFLDQSVRRRPGDIAAHRDYFAAVVFLKPRNDDRCIQPA